MGLQEITSSVAPDPLGVRPDRQGLDRLCIFDKKLRGTVQAKSDSGAGAHGRAPVARANSAATVSGDRCT